MVNDNECSLMNSSNIEESKNILFEADGVFV